MGKPHFTLNRRVNVAFIVAWGLGALLITVVAQPRPFITAAIGAASGLIAGLLQRGSVRAAPALFAQAQSALEVRRAFMSNRQGKLAIALQWATGVLLLVIGFARPGTPLLAFFAGYLSFMFLREVITLGVIQELEQQVPGDQHAF